MRQKGKLFIVLLISFIFLNLKSIWGQNVKLIEEIKFSQSPPSDVRSFCVTDDELVIMLDYQAGNVKIYEKNGKVLEVVNTIGRKGYGPDEFSKPKLCYYSNYESKLVVMDVGLRRVFVYDRIGRIEFKRVKEVFCWYKGEDIHLIGSKLFISGYTTDQNEMPYDLYYIDLTNDQPTFLLPSYLKYGLKSSRDYEIQFNKNRSIPAIGIDGLIDIHGDIAYIVWEGDLKITRINIVTGEIGPNPFGTKTHHYVKPYISQNMLIARSKRDTKLYLSEREKFSYVRNIFVSSKYILVIYEGPVNQGNASNFWLQFYTSDGDFIKELPIPGQPDWRMCFMKDGHLLYALSSKSNGIKKPYSTLKYDISK